MERDIELITFYCLLCLMKYLHLKIKKKHCENFYKKKTTFNVYSRVNQAN